MNDQPSGPPWRMRRRLTLTTCFVTWGAPFAAYWQGMGDELVKAFIAQWAIVIPLVLAFYVGGRVWEGRGKP